MRDWLVAGSATFIVPASVVQETAYLAGVRMGPRAEASFLHLAAREYNVEPLEHADLVRAADLVEAYADFPLGFVDASIVAMAERLDITTLLTTDRRHFGVVRPAHCPRLVLVP